MHRTASCRIHCLQIINGTLWVDHLPWHNYERGVPWHALSPDNYNTCVPLSLAVALIGAMSLGCRPDKPQGNVELGMNCQPLGLSTSNLASRSGTYAGLACQVCCLLRIR